MFGVVTRNTDACDEFDPAFYEVKDVTGRREKPVENAHNMVSVFADNRVVEDDKTLAPVNEEGERATRDHEMFDWDYVCPTSNYKDEMLDLIEECDLGEGIRLDTIGFPREGYCRCERCLNEFKDSELEWEEWRASVITDFLESAAELVESRLSLTLYPDPFEDHQYSRFGLDLKRASEIVDFFVVPIYDMAYATTHWLETLTWGFKDALEEPFYTELYAAPPVEHEELVKATRVALRHSDGVLFAYNDEGARSVIEELK